MQIHQGLTGAKQETGLMKQGMTRRRVY